MDQLIAVWTGLDLRRKVTVVLATVAMFAAILGLSRIASTPGMALLYAGLEPSAAGEVVQALEAQGVAYDVRGSGIYVDSAQRDTLRMTLASTGLPANGGQGYELLDSLSGFGTTSKMFDAAYWRAKEGEIARTILTSPGIRSARVHIAATSERPFRDRMDPSASVTVTAASGVVSAEHAMAFKHLVASAVAGLDPDSVTVIDSENGIVSGADNDPSEITHNREETLRNNVLRLLEARVGAGNAVVEVSIETNTDSEAIVERRLDPEGRVAVSTDTVETSSNEQDSGQSGVTVASNLPDGEAAGGGSSQSQNSETRERIDFQVSETTRELLRAPGATKRITVAVLVDGIRGSGPDGSETWEPRPPEELETLRALVASAVGFNAERGDQITLQTLELRPVAEEGTLAAPGLLSGLAINVMSVIQLLVLAAVALILGLFVIRPILSSAGATAAPGLPPPLPDEFEGAEGGEALSGELELGPFSDDPLPTFGDLPALDDLPAESPADRLRRLIDERQDDTVEVLRNWMEDKEERV